MSRSASVRRASVLTAMLVVALGLASCSPGSPGVGDASLSPAPSNTARFVECEELTLLTPQGNRIDLTGTWTGRGALHYVRQLGSCVWWIALSDIPGQPAGSAHSITFHGRLRPDFTLVGEWAFVVRPTLPGTPPSAMELITLTIEVDDAGGEEAIILRGPGFGGTFGPGFYDQITLTRVGPLPISQ